MALPEWISGRRRLIGAGALGVALAVAAGYLAIGAPRPDPARGAALYAENCAGCHGVNLEGAADWKNPGPDDRLPPPPHDASGHSWHHADALLFRIVRDGSESVIGGDYKSDMAGFGDRLSDGEIRDILAFIRQSWPERERNYQAQMTRQDEAAN